MGRLWPVILMVAACNPAGSSRVVEGQGTGGDSGVYAFAAKDAASELPAAPAPDASAPIDATPQADASTPPDVAPDAADVVDAGPEILAIEGCDDDDLSTNKSACWDAKYDRFYRIYLLAGVVSLTCADEGCCCP